MLTPRERVTKALNHEEPDRVPIDLFFHAGMLTDRSYFALKDHLGIQGDIAPFRQGLGANYYDERILEAQQIAIDNNPDHVIYNLNIDAGSMWARKLIDAMIADEQQQAMAAE